MTGPPVRWVVSPHDGACHALERGDAEQAPARGWAEALCGHIIPAAHGLPIADAPSGALCLPCAMGAAADLADPGRFGTCS